MIHLKVRLSDKTTNVDAIDVERITSFKLEFTRLISLLLPTSGFHGEVRCLYDLPSKRFCIESGNQQLSSQLQIINNHFVEFKREYL